MAKRTTFPLLDISLAHYSWPSLWKWPILSSIEGLKMAIVQSAYVWPHLILWGEHTDNPQIGCLRSKACTGQSVDCSDPNLEQVYLNDVLNITRLDTVFEVITGHFERFSANVFSGTCRWLHLGSGLVYIGVLPSLDITVTRNEDGNLTTLVYRKPTYTGQYLHFQSSHPGKHKR